MFRHKNDSSNSQDKPEQSNAKEKKEESKSPENLNSAPVGNKPQGDIRELMEKNLKWSQIIYEQNRKINNRLLWSAIASWIRLFVIAVPLILALWFLPPFIRDAQTIYRNFFGISANGVGQNFSLEQLLRLLPLDATKREQLKAMLK